LTELGRGYAGLQYPVTQVSLAVEDLALTMEQYWRVFGWSGWDVFDHHLPVHHATELRDRPVDYDLRGAEVMVGSLNFELLEPLEGPSLWREFIQERGEGIASIAVMFHTREDGEAVKREFAERGMPVTMKAAIGEHIEYYYLDTEERFGCLIESGSGHAADFVTPAYVYPTPDAPPSDHRTEARWTITDISMTVTDLDSKLQTYGEAFGWGPWQIFDSTTGTEMRDCSLGVRTVDDFRLRWAETRVGDLVVALAEPRGGESPWQTMLDRSGDGIASIGVALEGASPREAESLLAERGFSVSARASIGAEVDWTYVDTASALKCVVRLGGPIDGRVNPVATFQPA